MRIAIIAIPAAILLPVFAPAPEKARQTGCTRSIPGLPHLGEQQPPGKSRTTCKCYALSIILASPGRLKNNQSPAQGHMVGANYTISDGHVKWMRYEAAVNDNYWLWRRVKP